MSEFTVEFYDYQLIPESQYQAQIKKFENTISKFDDKPQIRATFELTDFTFEDKPDIKPTIVAYYTKTLSPKGNLTRKFLKPLIGETPRRQKGQKSLILDDFIGKKCLIQIEHKEREEDGETMAIVSTVLKPV